MNKKYFSILMLYLACCVFGMSAAAVAEPIPSPKNPASAETDDAGASGLTLEQAVAATMENSPDLNVINFNARLSEAEMLAAAVFPNPELKFEYENFDEPEKTLTIGYLLEIGGKRALRMDVAATAAELASVERDAARVELIYKTATAFIDVLAAQENLRIAMEKEKLANHVYEISRERADAGRVSPLEVITAEIKQRNARLEMQQAEDALLIARTILAAMWGGSPVDFKTAAGAFDRIQPIPSLDALSAAINGSPMIQVKQSEIKVAENSLRLEKRNRIPDLSISGGVKKADASDDTIYIVGVSLPIPLFDRNQAGVSRAAGELARGFAALAAEKNRLSKDLAIAYQTLKTAYQQANTIQTDILPSAQNVLAGIQEGYQEGEFSFLDMLEAQSTLYETHESYVRSLGQYHHAVIDLEKLLGQDLASFHGSDRSMRQ
jgi:cobalt-zinc-cadmium efflux system outer membrane protein